MEWSTRNRRLCYSSDFSSPCRIGLLVVSVKESEIRIAVRLPCPEENAPLCHRDPCRHIPLASLDDSSLLIRRYANAIGCNSPSRTVCPSTVSALSYSLRLKHSKSATMRTDIRAAVCSF